MSAGEVTDMPFICDPEYTEALRRLIEAMPGAACSYEQADPELLAGLHEKNMSMRKKKSTGAFYTPPEIVRFMCRESLASHISNCTGIQLDIVAAFFNEGSPDAASNISVYKDIYESIDSVDRALARVRIFDPSVGCGAFVLGMLDEIIRLRRSLTPFIIHRGQAADGAADRTTAQLLLYAVRNSIFAADIDSISVAITALRLWSRIVSALNHESLREGVNCVTSAQKDSEGKMLSYGSFIHNVIHADSIFGYNGGGFDIVIGNPPYVSAVEGAKKSKSSRLALREKFPLLSGAFDLYTAFLLDGILKTNENGVFCWIIPNKFLVSQYAAPVLEHLKENGLRRSISISDTGAFAKVGVYPIIITGNKCGAGNNAVKPDFEEYRADSLNDLTKRNIYPRIKPGEYDTFADHNIKIASGAAGFQARSLTQYIFDSPELAADEVGAIPFVVSGCIGRYSIRHEKVRYMGVTYEKAYIKKGRDIADSKWRLWQNDKICIAGLTKEIQAYYSCCPLALGVGTYAIYEFGDFDPLFLLGVLNSSFMSQYVSDKFHERHLSGKYLAISKSMLEQLPIVKTDKETQRLIASCAARLLELPPDDPEAERLSCDIDEIVGEMYDQPPQAAPPL